MKASIKFREDQKPLLRAKVPLNILGMPFQSGIVAGESKELTLNLSTFFESGPSIRIGYRPNDTWNPFSLIIKTGTGPFGSPNSSSMLMSAEFNLINQGNVNPSFMLHFKPNFGDFSIKKSLSSTVLEKKGHRTRDGAFSDEDGSIELVDAPMLNDGVFAGKRLAVVPPESNAGRVLAGLISGSEVAAKTSLPLRNHAVLNFRWGVRVPTELKSSGVDTLNPTAGISFQKIPFLAMNKIGIEHVGGADTKQENKAGPDVNLPRNFNWEEGYFTVKSQLDVLKAENGMLRNAVEDLRAEFSSAAAGKLGTPASRGSDSGKFPEMDKNGVKNRDAKGDGRGREKYNGYGSKSVEGDVNEELKKALMGGSGS